MKMPSNDAPIADIVAYCKWNDHHGCWPQARSSMTLSELAEVAPPRSGSQVWYDWEFAKWYADDELRVHLAAVLDHWRSDN